MDTDKLVSKRMYNMLFLNSENIYNMLSYVNEAYNDADGCFDETILHYSGDNL